MKFLKPYKGVYPCGMLCHVHHKYTNLLDVYYIAEQSNHGADTKYSIRGAKLYRGVYVQDDGRALAWVDHADIFPL